MKSDENIIEECKKYSTRKELNMKDSSLSTLVYKRNLKDKAFSHMTRLVNKYYSFEQAEKEAKKYNTKNEFKNKCSGLYQYACKQNIINEICSHMENGKFKYTEDEMRKTALKYNTRFQFQKKDKAIYQSAKYRGMDFLNDICSHMKEVLRTWTKEEVQNEAMKFKKRKEFELGNSKAYAAARRLKILDLVCEHMKYGFTGFDKNKKGYLYYLSINNGTAYKIGITNQTIKERFTNEDLEKIKVIFIKEYDRGHEAFTEERRILREYKKYRYTGDKLLSSGNTELFKIDIFSLD